MSKKEIYKCRRGEMVRESQIEKERYTRKESKRERRKGGERMRVKQD